MTDKERILYDALSQIKMILMHVNSFGIISSDDRYKCLRLSEEAFKKFHKETNDE